MIDAEYLKRERNPEGCGQYLPTSYCSVSGSFEAVGANALFGGEGCNSPKTAYDR